MADFTYNVLTEATTKLKNVHQEQIEIEIDLADAPKDPLTLAQIREDQTIRSCFRDRAKNINDLILAADTQMGKTKVKSEQDTILNQLNQKVGVQVHAIETEVQQRVTAFIENQKKHANAMIWAQAKMRVKVLYSIAKLGSGVAQTVGKVMGAMLPGAGLFLTVAAAKGVIDNCNDLRNVITEVLDSRDGEVEVRKKLKTAVADLRKLKPPEKVPQSKIDAVQNLMVPYSVRLASIDTGAKALAGKLDTLLKVLEKHKFRHQKTQDSAEAHVHELIQDIIKASQSVTKGKGLLTSAKDAMKDAAGRAQKDPASFWSVAGTLWKKLDLLIGGGEEVEKLTDFTEQANAFVKSLVEGLQQEMRDADIEEHLKV